MGVRVKNYVKNLYILTLFTKLLSQDFYGSTMEIKLLKSHEGSHQGKNAIKNVNNVIKRKAVL